MTKTIEEKFKEFMEMDAVERVNHVKGQQSVDYLLELSDCIWSETSMYKTNFYELQIHKRIYYLINQIHKK